MSPPDDAAVIALEAVRRATTPPDAKRPLFRELPPAPVFPLDALCALRPAAEAVHLRTQAPIAICAQSVLAAATLAIQPHYDVDVPGVGRRPLTGAFLSVAESGERKTSVDRLALKPVYKVERDWNQQRDAQLQDYRNAHDAWKAAREHAQRTGKGDPSAIRRAFDEIGPEPMPPAPAMLLVADPTPEALVLHLAEGRPWGGLFTAEAGLFIGGAAFSDESKLRTAALLNTLWDGEPIRRRRVLTGSHFLPGRRCSAHLMMQRVVSDRLLGDAQMKGIGLLARCLIVAPDSTAGTRFFREPGGAALAASADYEARLGVLLNRKPRMAPDTRDVLDPLPLPLDADARTMFVQFYDAVEAELRAEGGLASVRAFGAKMAEHAARIAAVLAVYADPDAMEVPSSAMAGAIVLVQHYAAEMQRMTSAAAVAPDLMLAQRLLAWWQGRGPAGSRLHLSTIYQRGLNAIGDAATARRIVAILEDHGWAKALPPGTEIDGAPRREAWELVP